jgi:hypothetical protein
MSVSRYGPSCEPAGLDMGVMGFGFKTPEPTHTDCPGGQHTPGLIGGWDCPCECHRRPSPGRLWQQAEQEHPDDIDRHRALYRELMIEHGHLVERKPDDDPNLPCGWPGKRVSDAV